MEEFDGSTSQIDVDNSFVPFFFIFQVFFKKYEGLTKITMP